MSVVAAPGLAVSADPSLRRLAPRVWVGGSPLRILRMSGRGDTLLSDLTESGTWHPTGAAEVSLRDRLLDAGAVHPVALPVSRDGDDADLREVTAVIPVRDDASGLAALLGDLCAEGAAGLRIVVVDDGSRDPAAVRSLADAHRATLVRHDRPRGPAAARNSGLALVDTPVVVFVDADVRAPRRWLGVLLVHFADPRVVAVAPRVRSAGGRGVLSRYDMERGPLDLGTEPAIVRPRSKVAYVPSAALVVRTARAHSLGGFDEDLRFGEDVDLVWRLGEAGGVVRYEPASVLHHRSRSGLGAWLSQRVDYGSSAAQLHTRHHGDVAPLVISPWSAAAWVVTAMGHPVLGTGVAVGSAVAFARRLPALGVRPAVTLALRGHLAAGDQIGGAMVRPWWPVTLGASMVSCRARRVALVAVVSLLVRSPGSPLTRVLGVIDDLAYSTGVWKGAMRARDLGALMPAFVRQAGPQEVRR